MDEGKSIRESGEIFFINVDQQFSWAMSGDICGGHKWDAPGIEWVGPGMLLSPHSAQDRPNPQNDPVLNVSGAKGGDLDLG